MNILCKLRKSSKYVLREICGEGILIEISGNRKIHLNSTGVYIWKLLDKNTPNEIAKKISKESRVSSERVVLDIESFITKLLYFSVLEPCSIDEFGKTLDINLQNFLFKARELRWPFTGVLELTHQCNFRCKHCYIPLENRKKGLDNELTVEEWKKVLDRISKLGTFLILFTGGEPMLKKGFEEIYVYAKKLGFHITIYTNGFYCPERLLTVLVKYPPAVVDISLYGASNESYKAFTGVENGWERVRKLILALKGFGIELKAKAQLNYFTEGEIRKIQGFTEGLGIPFRYRGTISPGLENTDVCRIMLNASQIVDFEKMDREKVSNLVRFNPFLRKLLLTNPFSMKWPCGAGVTSYIIQPSGRVTLCTQLREPTYDLRQHSLEEIWNRFPKDINKFLEVPIIKKQEKKCEGCKLFEQCEICPAWIIRCGEKTVKEYINSLCKLAERRSSVFRNPQSNGNKERG